MTFSGIFLSLFCYANSKSPADYIFDKVTCRSVAPKPVFFSKTSHPGTCYGLNILFCINILGTVKLTFIPLGLTSHKDS